MRGNHIVVPRLYDGPQACVLQQPDRRIVFTIPYEQDWTLIGTTEVDCARPGDAQTDAAEIDYLCTALALYFRFAADAARRGLALRRRASAARRRPCQLARQPRLAARIDAGPPPLVSVYGGKLTTCRRLAEAVVDRLAAGLGCRAPAWTAGGPALPGGDFDDREALLRSLRATQPWLPPALAAAGAGSYARDRGCSVPPMRSPDSARDFGPGCMRPRSITWCRPNGRARPDDAVAAQQARAAHRGGSSGAARGSPKQYRG